MKKLLLALILSVCSALPAFAAAFTASCSWSVGGGNANYGSQFDPSQTAGMLTNLASTSSSSTTPTFSSASYTFVAGDVGNWVFVGAGASWQLGFYKITSLSGNNAVVDAAIGHVVLYAAATNTYSLSTVAGCGATANGTFSVNYSGPGQTADNVTNSTFGDATTANTTLTNTVNTFTPVMVGNAVHITAIGTNGVLGYYTILTYIDAKDVTINVTSNNGTTSSGMTGFIGGSLAALNNIGANTVGLCPVSGNWVWVGTGYTAAATDTLAFSGSTTAPVVVAGYKTYWMDLANPTRANSGSGALTITNFPVLAYGASYGFVASGSDIIVEWIAATCSKAAAAMNLSGSNEVFFGDSVNNSGVGGTAYSMTSGTGLLMFNCDAIESAATGAGVGVLVSGGGSVINSRISNSSNNAAAYGINSSANGTVIIGNQLLGAGGFGIFLNSATAADVVYGNTVVGFVDDCNMLTGGSKLPVIVNNMFTDSTNGYNNVSAANAAFLAYNRFHNNSGSGIATPSSWSNYTNFNAQVTANGSAYNDYNSATNLIPLSNSAAVAHGFFPSATIGAIQLSATGGEVDSAYVK